MKRLLGVVTAAVMALAVATPVAAAQPNNQACLGHDFSAFARAGIVGGFVSGLATTTGGVGSEIQAHLAGLVPDMVVPNTCNDD